MPCFQYQNRNDFSHHTVKRTSKWKYYSLKEYIVHSWVERSLRTRSSGTDRMLTLREMEQHKNMRWRVSSTLSWDSTQKALDRAGWLVTVRNWGVLREEDSGLRWAQEAELQTVTSSANSSCKSKSNLPLCTVWKGPEITDWSLSLHPHIQTAVTERNITSEGPREVLFIYLYPLYLLWGSFITRDPV